MLNKYINRSSNTVLDNGYDVSQTVAGRLAEFNMWNFELSQDELNFNTCDKDGNVVSWNTLQERGTSTRSVQSFPVCNRK